jgi:predicted RNA-binding protein
LAASGLLVTTMPVLAQSALLPPPAVLKKLSVEELLDIDVTSVSKKEEKLSRRDLLDNRHPEFGQPVNRREIPRSILARITWYR